MVVAAGVICSPESGRGALKVANAPMYTACAARWAPGRTEVESGRVRVVLNLRDGGRRLVDMAILRRDAQPALVSRVWSWLGVVTSAAVIEPTQ